MGIYFRTDNTRLTFRELWGIHRRMPVFLSACLMKILGLRTPLRLATLHEEIIRMIPAESVPPAAMRALRPDIEDFQHGGAELAFYHSVSGTFPLQGYAAVLLCPERNALLTVTWATARHGGAGSEAHRAILSQLKDGTFLATSGNRQSFNPAPGVTVFRYLDALSSELMERHQQHLAEIVVPPLPVANAVQAQEVLVAMKRHTFEANTRRGIWVPLTRDELEQLGLPSDE
jgi:hypothetical protein